MNLVFLFYIYKIFYMDKKIETFQSLCKIFSSHGYNLYLVGGTVRDYLLHRELDDFDVVSDATPEEMKSFLIDADFTFSRFGSVKLHFDNIKFDITTLRKESSYQDSRHPRQIIFVKNLEEDVVRRDFTINALYMDANLQIIDFVNGRGDLIDKKIKMIGNPDIRLKEDPLRIIRAIRFAVTLGFDIDKELLGSIKRNKDLVKKLNIDKVKQDIKKCPQETKLLEYLNELEIL